VDSSELGSVKRTTYAVLITDVYQFSLLSGRDEERVIERVAADLITFRETAERHRGRVVTDRGDGLKIVFDSAVEAFKAALEMQTIARDRTEREQSRNLAIRHRIGLHFGDVMVVESPMGDEPKVTGQAVSVAARLEQACSPGQVCFSFEVHEMIKGVIHVPTRYLGAIEVKNLPNRIRAWCTGDEQNYEAVAPQTPSEERMVRRALDQAKREFQETHTRMVRSWIVGAVLIAVIAGASAVLYARWANAPQPGPYWTRSSVDRETFDASGNMPKGGSLPSDTPKGKASEPGPTAKDPEKTGIPRISADRNEGGQGSQSEPGSTGSAGPEPDFDLDSIEQQRQDLYRGFEFGRFRLIVSSIKHWQQSASLTEWYAEAARLEKGYSAFKSLVARANGTLIETPGESVWNAVAGMRGTTILLRYAETVDDKLVAQDVMDKQITEMSLSELRQVYNGLANHFHKPSGAVESWLSSISEWVQ